MPFVSVIIPCYNISHYIQVAVNSVLSQSLQNFEIIIINDGSTDDTEEILKKYSQNSQIKIENKSNGGLSSARNKGLDLATGEYILFLDGDDWLENEALEVLYNKANEENLDLLIADTLFYYSKNEVHLIYKRPELFETVGIKSGKEYFVALKKHGCYAPMACNQIYKRTFLLEKGLRFTDKLINEDELWTPLVLMNAQRVNCISFPFYYYLQRDQSIMNSSVSLKKINDNIFIADSLIRLVNHQNGAFKAWMWVKSFELYYRAITVYNTKGLETARAEYYNLYCLFKSNIVLSQQLICLRYLKKSYPRNLLYKAYLLCGKLIVKFIKN